MKHFWKYLAAVLAAAILGYLAYRYRNELLSLAKRAKGKCAALKGKCAACREEQNDFADL